MCVCVCVCVCAVASLGWVTPGAATEGVTSLFFPEKPGELFSVASSAVCPLASSSQKLTTFFAHRCHYLFIAFTPVSTPPRYPPHLFLPVRSRFSTILCKFAHKKYFSFGCHPPGGCHPGRSAPHPLPSSDATVCRVKTVDRQYSQNCLSAGRNEQQ